MLTLSTYAENLQLPQNITEENNLIKVIQQSGNEENIIYTGPLSGYENGKWSDISFDVRFTEVI